MTPLPGRPRPLLGAPHGRVEGAGGARQTELGQESASAAHHLTSLVTSIARGLLIPFPNRSEAGGGVQCRRGTSPTARRPPLARRPPWRGAPPGKAPPLAKHPSLSGGRTAQVGDLSLTWAGSGRNGRKCANKSLHVGGRMHPNCEKRFNSTSLMNCIIFSCWSSETGYGVPTGPRRATAGSKKQFNYKRL
jgi:hypothetical protein